MSDIGKVTIEPVGREGHMTHHVSTAVNVGGSLVAVECDTDQDRELAQIVEQLHAKLRGMALDVVRAALHHEG